MAITFAGNAGSAASATAGTTVAFATTRTITVGEKFVFAIGFDARLGTVSTISDGSLNTYAKDAAYSAIADDSLEFWSTTVGTQIPSGTTITVTFTTSGGFARAVIGDVFDSVSTAAIDKTSGAPSSNFGTSVNTGTTGVLSASGELAYSAAFVEAAVTISTTASYTQTASIQSGTALTLAAQYQILAATTAQNPSVSWTGGQSCGAAIETFLAATAVPDTLWAQSCM
jgi:hypothetical protein